MQPMKIQKQDLLRVIDILKGKINEHFDESIEVAEEEYYWEIPLEDLYDPTTKPEDLTLGQLSEDWKELLRLKEKDSIPISYDLIRLSVILEIIKKKSSGKW